jgi:hypothetical protein
VEDGADDGMGGAGRLAVADTFLHQAFVDRTVLIVMAESGLAQPASCPWQSAQDWFPLMESAMSKKIALPSACWGVRSAMAGSAPTPAMAGNTADEYIMIFRFCCIMPPHFLGWDGSSPRLGVAATNQGMMPQHRHIIIIIEDR